MTRIYITPFFINSKNIPNHASTHYSYDIYPAKPVTPKTQAGFAPKPMIQRKTVKDARPLVQAEKIILGPIVEAPKTRHKFRKDINKEALAQYFDNDVLPSRAEIAQEKLDTWLMQTMFELENADIAKAQQQVTEEEILKFVASHVEDSMLQYFAQYTFDKKPYDIDEGTYDPWAKIAEYAHDLDWTENKVRANQYVGINSIDATKEDKFERLFFENEVNASVADHFINKHSGADTAAAMRALDKAKRNNKYMLRKIEKTK